MLRKSLCLVTSLVALCMLIGSQAPSKALIPGMVYASGSVDPSGDHTAAISIYVSVTDYTTYCSGGFSLVTQGDMPYTRLTGQALDVQYIDLYTAVVTAKTVYNGVPATASIYLSRYGGPAGVMGITVTDIYGNVVFDSDPLPFYNGGVSIRWPR